MNINKFVLLFAIIVSLSFATVNWEFQDASGKICFNLSSDGYIYGQPANTYYSVPIVQLNNNNSFANSAMKMSYNGVLYQIYKLGDNGANAEIAFVSANNSAIGSKSYYCIYSGGTDNRGTSDMQSAFFGSSGGYFESIAKINISSSSGYTRNGVLGSINVLNGTNDLTRTCNTTACDGISLGVDTSNKDIIYRYDYFIDTPFPTSIANRKFLVYYDNYTPIYSLYTSGLNGGQVLSVFVDGRQGNPYSPPSWNNVVWSIMSRNGDFDQNFTVSNVNYDFRDLSISIISPVWDSSYLLSDAIPYTMQSLKAYDNCTFYLNDNQFSYITNTTISQITSGTLSNLTIGKNQMKVSCMSSGVESHNYVSFFVSSANIQDLFAKAFGIDVSALCSGTVVSALSNCDESYSTYSFYRFSGVVCPNLNSSINYSCVGISNFSKNNYTMFYSPNTWTYAEDNISQDMQHVGAIFQYNLLQFPVGIELLSDHKFIYIPAQNKTRDCGIYNLNTNYCSWWGGIVLNNASTYVASTNNNWYVASGLGLSVYNENISQIVVNVNLIPIAEGGNISDFGFFTRASCFIQNDSFNVIIQNTKPQNFLVTVLGNTSYAYNLNSTTLQASYPLNGTTFISVIANTKVMCEYDGSTNIFLPAGFTLPFTEGFGNFFPKVMILLTVVLSTIIPYALFGLFIFNDLYHVIPISYIGVLTIFSVVGGLVNNISPFERGVKHMVILLAIVIAYIVTLAPMQTAFSFNVSVYTQLMNDFRNIMFSTDIYSLTLGLFTFIADLFLKLIFLPVTLIQLIYDLMLLISPTLFTSFVSFQSYLEAGAMVYFYLKAYEVIANRFRIV